MINGMIGGRPRRPASPRRWPGAPGRRDRAGRPDGCRRSRGCRPPPHRDRRAGLARPTRSCRSMIVSSSTCDSPARVHSTPASSAIARPLRWATSVVCSGQRARVADRRLEQPGGRRRDQQGPDRSTAGGLAGDGHPVRVAAEGRDVAPDPAQRLDLVEQTTVVRGVGDPAEAVEAEPVGDRHGDDAVAVEGDPVVPGAGRRPRLEPAAVDPDQHRQPGVAAPRAPG